MKKIRSLRVGKGKKSRGGHAKVRRAKAAAASAFPTGDTAFPGSGMPATPPDVPDMPMPNPGMGAAPGGAMGGPAPAGPAPGGMPPLPGMGG